MRLHEFITVNRDEIISLTANRFQGRPWPSISAPELGAGVPLFLTQLVETLRLAWTGADVAVPDAIAATRDWPQRPGSPSPCAADTLTVDNLRGFAATVP